MYQLETFTPARLLLEELLELFLEFLLYDFRHFSSPLLLRHFENAVIVVSLSTSGTRNQIARLRLFLFSVFIRKGGITEQTPQRNMDRLNFHRVTLQ